ncbi:MAG: hypothetical protein C0478_10870 [Planctomyces sp.]|nr:hypothetical protein [Planctomyces sp.]
MLDAPQPLSSWSRAQWVPLARQAGRDALVAAALDSMRTDAQRIRAIEAITELYAGLKPNELDSIAKASTAPIQARAIWSTFRGGDLPDAKLLVSLLSTPTPTQPTTVNVEPLVTQAIFEGVLTTDPAKISSEWWNQLAPAITSGLSHSDRLCRLLASRLVARIPEEGLLIVAGEAGKKGPRAALAYAHGWVDRTDSLKRRMDSSAAQVAVKVLQKSNDAELQQEAIRLMEKILGGVGGPTDVPPAFLGYVPGLNLLPVERQIDQLRIDLAQVYLERAIVDRVELERLLAMIELAHEPVLTKLLDQLTPASHPVDDIHVLAVSACMRVARTAAHRDAIATAFLRLDQKMTERKLPRDTFWNDRVRDIYNAQCATDELLPVIMAQHPELGRSQHVLYLAKFPGELFAIALAGFLKQIEADPSYQWSSDVLFLLASSNEPAHREMVRKQAQEFRLKSAAIIALSDKPDAIDRPLFLDGLAAPQKEVIAAAITALEALPPASDAASQLAILSAARKLQSDKGEYRLREKLIQLLERNLDHRETQFIPGEAGFVPQTEAMSAWEACLIRRFPQEMANRINSASEDHREVVAAWREAKGATGDAERGAILFRSRTCHQCHSAAGQSTSNALGPDLAGAAKRFSRDDLLLAIIDPSRDVSSRYQATLIEHKDGRSLSGMVVYESVDGLLLRNATGQVVRVEASEIEERRLMSTSLMPAGLLKGASVRELADLEAYLQKTE